MKRFIACFACVLMLVSLCACGKTGGVKELSKLCGINLAWGDVVSSEDTHGFHGDGYGVVKLHYTDGSVSGELAENEHWNKLPLSDELNSFVYQPSDWMPSVPEIENGYYWFYDRHSEAEDPYDDTAFPGRSSVNFTLAIYDTDSNDLYLYEYDT